MSTGHSCERWLIAILLSGLAFPGLCQTATPALTPAQRVILAGPAGREIDAGFAFSRPAGPQFTEAEKRVQRTTGATVLPLVTNAFQKGMATVRIPPGNYRFGRERWGPEGVIYPLEFSQLRRGPENPFVIDATGATFWFDLPDDQAPTAHFCVGFKQCRNVVFRGATLDRATRGHIEGRILVIDAEKNRFELALSPGIVVPPKFSAGLEQRVVPFKADGTFCASLYALQAGGTRLKYKSITPVGAGRCWVEMQEPDLMRTLQDPQWVRDWGEGAVLRAGDGLSCIYAVSCAIEIVGSEQVTIEGLSVYMPKGWGAEWGGGGGHLWKNCYFGPRPGTSQWQGGEGFMFCATRTGTTLDHVSIRHTTDDMANIHGYWGFIKALAGDRVTFEPGQEFRRTVLKDAVPGDRLVFLGKTTGAVLGSAVTRKVDGATFTVDRAVDRAVDGYTNAVVEFPEHECAGWLIQNCDWRDNYQRLLVQSGPGTVRDCTFTRVGSSLELNSVMPYVEGGIPHDIVISENVFDCMAPFPGGAVIRTYLHTFARDQAPQLKNIRIEGNRFRGPGDRAIAADHIETGRISGNRLEGRAFRAADPLGPDCK